MNILVFDTETTSVNKPFCYNIGWLVYNTDTKEVLVKKDYVVEQVWHNPMLFVTAYYADKREIYVSRLKGRRCVMEKFGYITRAMYRDIVEYGIEHAYAYNSKFDEGVFEYNRDWFKCINPLDTVQVHDIRGYVHNKIAFTDSFQAYCDLHQLYTESGNYSTTAEAVYRFILQDEEFIEEHTALADSEIELAILCNCVEQGAEWNTDYKVYASIPKNSVKELEIVDAEGNSHKFQYTTKRKLKEGEGFRLTLKQ